MSKRELATADANNSLGITNDESTPDSNGAGFVGVPAVENPFEKDFKTFATGLFLPRLQLEGSSSENVKLGLASRGRYSLVTARDKFEDLGTSVDVLVLCYRTKALDMRQKPKKIISVYDKESPMFQEIQAVASVKGQGMTGCMYGLEFLVYIPGAKNEQKFATFFCGNPTQRVASQDFAPILKSRSRAATLQAKIINNGIHIWDGPVILPCNTPLSHYPSQEDMVAQQKAFLNPAPGPVVETITEDEAAATSGRER